jgi:Fe-S oxidoreductase/FAD/FMN-containing dehydrogenase
MFGPDTSTVDRATVGGMVGNKSAGSASVRYGMTVDHVEALDVVLADGSRTTLGPVDESHRARRAARDSLDGRIHHRLALLLTEAADPIATGFPEHWRRAGGYRLDRLAAAERFDPGRLVVGSEGTLAVATRAFVRLVPRPRSVVHAVGHFTSVAAALDAVGDALDCEPMAVELIDRTILDLSRRSVEYRGLAGWVEGDPEALLYVTLTGDTEAEAVAGLDRLEAAWTRHAHGFHTARAVTAAQSAALLKVRTAGLGLLMAASTGTRRPVAFVEDTAVDPARLPAYTAALRTLLDRHGLTAGFYGHASVGCLHVRPFVDVADPREVRTMRRLADEVRALAAEHGGVNSSEHGDGLARSEFNRSVFGPDLYEAMRAVKRIFDPDGVLNPGKIVDAPRMTEHLRDATLPPAPPIRTTLSFADSGGMRAAADRCMNIGLCRKTTTGVMCPSYVATGMEEHSTRGRAGALVKALSDPDPHTALADDRLHEILDLCLMCKACTSECPLGVDITTLKSEALAARHEVTGVPLRSRVFGSIRALNRLGAATAPLANLVARTPAVRAALDQRLGIAGSRRLPEFSSRTLTRWHRSRESRENSTAGAVGTVTLLADSFTTFTDPDVGRAAVELLEAAGWRVRLESRGCCGRAALSKGLLADARRQADRLVARLHGTPGPIVGVEPSCLFTLRDEHRALLPRDRRVEDVAGRVVEVEGLLATAVDDGRLVLRQDSWLAGRTVLVHGHCHQRAAVGTAATLALLRMIPGADVVELDAGCCGMAGSFGFESEHYALSLTVGEDRLFPAVRAAGADVVVAAPGVSCRQQVEHGTGRRAHHPLQLLHSVVEHQPASSSRTRSAIS